MTGILAKNLMILASAGSGKTYQLGNRVIGKIGCEGVSPERLVALTFTRKAAGEFADSVLGKLAKGTLDNRAAEAIFDDLGSRFDLGEVLEKVVRSLPELQLTTMDGFFSRVLRGFQYELGLSGGTFDLLEGERLATAEADILEGVLRDGFAEREEFYHAFRRATLGRGEPGVQRSLEDFIGRWHQIWKSGVRREHFGNPAVFGTLPKVGDWEAQKDGLIAALRGEDRSAGWDGMLDLLANHRVGRALKPNAFGGRLLDLRHEPGPVEVKDNRRMITVDGEEWRTWRTLFQLAIECEMASAVEKSQAVGELMAQIDAEHARQLRKRGMLSFDDVKILLGAWSQSEEARLRRELVDYRLDGRYDHWLLDEFQDTSPAEWRALEPLIDEAVADPEGSFFVVGDRKQGIYAWRGGEVGLFDEILQKYGRAFETESMEVSYRSCPAVLALVNAVCGNLPLIERLFGKAVREQWEWRDHRAADPAVAGEARVIEVARDGEGEALVEEMRRLGIGEKQLTCGVLVRTGDQVRKYAELLRGEGFDVIESGKRQPGLDHAVGVAIRHLLEWLADPANDYSREVLAMSPLGGLLARFGDGWGQRWDRVLREIQGMGYARFVSALIAPEWGSLGPYGRRRAEDLLAALADFDAGSEGSPRAAAAWIRELEVSQPPGVAAIQVMTIHKSKGLGFDVVFLPEVPDRTQVPDSRHFQVARGREWLLQVPGKWAFEKYPATEEAFHRWGEGQKYEMLCLWYVALTRAKRGLYLFLPEEPASRRGKAAGEAHATPANLIRQSTGVVFPECDPEWTQTVPETVAEAREEAPLLPPGQPQRSRTTPSSGKGEGESGGGSGRGVGLEVHRLFEKIAWLAPGEIPPQPFSAAGKIVEEALAVPALHRVFENRGAELYREQAIELIDDGKWVSAVIDRLHVERRADGKVLIEVIDFKTDAVAAEAELAARYAGQMAGYETALARVFEVGRDKIRSFLFSTHLGKLIEVDKPGSGSEEGA